MSPDEERFNDFRAELKSLCEKHGVCLLASAYVDDNFIYVAYDSDPQDQEWLEKLENDLCTPL